MMRFLKGNARCSTPTSICCLDVESTTQQARELLSTSVESFARVTSRYLRYDAGEVSRCHTQVASSKQEWWTYSIARMARNRPLWIFAYDVTRAMTLLGAWQEIDSGQLKVVTLIDGDPPVLCTLQSPNGKMIWCDLRNWYRMPWQEIHDSVCDSDLDGSDWMDSTSLASNTSYVKAVMSVRAVLGMLNFCREHDLGNWRPTVAAQAMQLYRHRFGPRKTRTRMVNEPGEPVKWETITQVWPLVHDKRDIHDFERAANYGGQDSCYFVGQIMDSKQEWENGLVIGKTSGLPFLPGPVYYVDANSAYPYVMHERKYPAKLVGDNDYCAPSHLEYLTNRYCVLANVCINCTDDTYPVRYNNRVIYASGQFWTTLCGDELQRALERDDIVNVGYHVCYTPMDLFTDYVEYLYGKKLEYKSEGNQAYYAIVKLLLNGLYGKFSQRSRRWEPACYPLEHDRWSRWISYDLDNEHATLWRSLGGQSQRMNDAATVPYGMPAISAVVTANVREYMRTIRQVAGERNVLYQGTDGLLLLKEGYDSIVDSGYVHDTRLGAMRLVGVYDSSEIRGPQDYTLGSERIVRGLPQDARQTGEHTYQHEVRSGLAGIVSRTPGDTVSHSIVTKDYQPTFRYGHIGTDGWVKPYTFTIDKDGNNAIQT